MRSSLPSKAEVEAEEAQKDFLARHPLFHPDNYPTVRLQQFPTVRHDKISLTDKKDSGNLLKLNPNTEIWVCLDYYTPWLGSDYVWNFHHGFYSFNPADPVDFELVSPEFTNVKARYGVGLTSDGHLYTVDYEQDDDYIQKFYLYNFNTDDWTYTKEDLGTDAWNLVASETAQAEDGTVYGEFYTSDGSAFEYGTIDYATKTRTTIGPASQQMVAMGITSDGVLYGIGDDGNLYKIDTTNGTETLIGATGLHPNGYRSTGEIDQKDNTFYWMSVEYVPSTGGQNTGLYTVDLNTGAATKIADDDGAFAYGMVIPAPPSSQEIPAKVTNVNTDFEGASLTGNVNFKAPTKTYSDKDLTETIDYKVTIGDDVLSTGTASPGDSVSAEVTVPKSGEYTFGITTSNSYGTSKKVNITSYIGYDTPDTVTRVTASANGKKVTVSWNKPTKGIHGNTLGDLTYDVLRIFNGDSVNVATNVVDTFYVDSIPASDLAYYTYAVKAKSEGYESKYVSSNGVIAGDAIEPDPVWTSEFSTEGDYALYTVINGGGSTTWYYDGDNHYARTNWDWDGNDDWLITPPIHMQSDRDYTISFLASGSTTHFEAKFGSAPTVEGMTTSLVDTTALPYRWQQFTYTVNAPVEGNYYFGFRDNNKEKSWGGGINIDSISVRKGALYTAPSAVNSLVLTPDAYGKLKAELMFSIPWNAINGTSIDSVDSIHILRDGELITTLPAASAGDYIFYDDNAVPSNGVHRYEVTTYKDGEFGKSASVSDFIGQDIPAAPGDVDLFDNVSNILAYWPKFSNVGANGRYVNSDHVAVSLFKLIYKNRNYYVGDSITTSQKGARSVEVPINPEASNNSDGKTQSLLQLGACADGDAGITDYYFTYPIIVGPSINLPFKESRKGATNDNGFAWSDGNGQYMDRVDAASWIMSTQSQDDDGGSFLWAPYRGSSGFPYTIADGDETSINTPKVTLQGAVKPKLVFYVNAIENDEAHLKVNIETPDGVNHEAADYDLSNEKPGWKVKEIDLSPYLSQRYIMAKFNGVAQGSNVSIGLDNVNIFDQLDYDLVATAISVPKKAAAGTKAKVKVNVSNYGSRPVSNYDVVLFEDDKAVDTVSINKSIVSLASDTVELFAPVKANQDGDINVKAVVEYSNDLDDSNNSTDTKVLTIVPSELPKVVDLGAVAEKNGVGLNWTKPIVPKTVRITDDFESYEPFATEFGDWTLVDGDQGLAGGFFSNYSYPGENTAFAFDIFNPNAITDQFSVVDNNPGVKPHSGNQYAGAPYVVNPNDGRTIIDADNWLISPKLSGNEQTIKFYALNITGQRNYYPYDAVNYNENFDVLYSKGSDPSDINGFVKIESDVADGQNLITDSANWKEFSVVIPDSANYFAIHHNTPAGSNYLFGIDDIEYEQTAPGANDSIIGYNVYRDGELIATVYGGNLTSFTDVDVTGGNHIYNITVAYQDADGVISESSFSNDASITVVDGIEQITANENGLFNVYAIDGKTVRLNAKNLVGLQRGVYIINNKKYIIK